jgi:raffinose/stachyose/melibiose transport system permease protein
MAVFMYHGFVKGIPVDLEDASRIDGCTLLMTFRHVVFPLLLPITATIGIMNLLWMWNDFLLPLIMLQSPSRYTLLLSTNMLFGKYASDWPAILSALILSALPMVIVYILLQKHIIKGITEGALKG